MIIHIHTSPTACFSRRLCPKIFLNHQSRYSYPPFLHTRMSLLSPLRRGPHPPSPWSLQILKHTLSNSRGPWFQWAQLAPLTIIVSTALTCRRHTTHPGLGNVLSVPNVICCALAAICFFFAGCSRGCFFGFRFCNGSGRVEALLFALQD